MKGESQQKVEANALAQAKIVESEKMNKYSIDSTIINEKTK